MNNTNLDVFAEGEGKTAEFIAYLTDRVPYFDAAEKKYVLLTKEKISEYIKKANAEGDTLKAFELLEAAKKSFGTTTPFLSAQIISKSVRIPGDTHLKLLAASKGLCASESLKEVIYPRMELLLEDLKKLKGVNNEKLQQTLRSFAVWKQASKGKGQGEEASEFISGMFQRRPSTFSGLYNELIYQKDFYEPLKSLLSIRAKAIGKQNGMSQEDVNKAFSENNWDVAFLWDSAEQALSWQKKEDKQKQEVGLEFTLSMVYSPDDGEILKEEIGNEWFKEGITKLEDGDIETFSDLGDFRYAAPLSIGNNILFKGKPLLEENKNWISKEIFKDLCKEFEFKNANVDEITAQIEPLINKGEFDRAADLQKQVVESSQLLFLADSIAECLLDVLKTSKVVTFTMPAGLLGLFEANASFILEPIKSKKQEGAHQ